MGGKGGRRMQYSKIWLTNLLFFLSLTHTHTPHTPHIHTPQAQTCWRYTKTMKVNLNFNHSLSSPHSPPFSKINRPAGIFFFFSGHKILHIYIISMQQNATLTWTQDKTEDLRNFQAAVRYIQNFQWVILLCLWGS